ncbi:MAG: PDZ domain-containing protein, partial [Thermomicrobiales bacterium]
MPAVSSLSHRRVALAPESPALIDAVASDSLGEEIGLAAGDVIAAIDGRPVEDALDFQYLAQSESVTLEV